MFINCGGTAASFLGSEECEARGGAQVVGFVPGRCKRKLFSRSLFIFDFDFCGKVSSVYKRWDSIFYILIFRFMLMKIRLNDFSGATLSLSVL